MRPNFPSPPYRLLLAAGALSVLALGSGCALAALGGPAAYAAAGGTAVYMQVAQDKMAAGPSKVVVGQVAYEDGDLRTALPTGIEPAAHAVSAALSRLAYTKISEKTDTQTGTFVAITGSNKRIVIGLDNVSDTLTQVTIRVGSFGDETLARHILDQIKKNL